MNKEIEKIYKRAYELMNDKKHQECIDEFLNIIEEHNDPAEIATIMIATLYYLELNDADKALPYARKAVEEKPDDEKRSICLVHCLFATGRHVEVSDEIKRYVATGNEIKHYKILFDENNFKVDDFR